MTPAEVNAQPTPRPPSIERDTALAIQPLAARGAFLMLPDDVQNTERLAVAMRGSTRPGRTIALSAFERARRFGWVVADIDGSRLWRISALGLEAVRRSRSEPANAKGSDKRSCVATSATSHLSVPECNRPGFDPDESPLAWLRRRKDKDGRPMITDIEFQAGERLRADFWRAALTPRTTTNWQAFGMGGRSSPSGLPGTDISDSAAAAQSRVARALAAAGADFSGILIDTCAHLKGLSVIEMERGWPQRSGKVVLQFALRALARHYGYLARDRDTTSAPDALKMDAK